MVHALFNQIAPRYDLLNRLLSFGQDQFWRRRVLDYLPERSDLKVLDLATGTADLALMMVQNSRQITSVTGVDMAIQMLCIGQDKVEKAGYSACVSLERGDAQHLVFQDNSFDVVTVAFGLRNMPQKDRAISEMLRVLRPSGRLIILEFSLPKNPVIRWFYLLYFRHILPIIGGLISGDSQAYRYLNQSVESFSSKEIDHMQSHSLCFGVATIYVADKLA
ncbi:MAG: bifunctional demethylmenaquinone methyltransferase/2-methoxy-6-polyprenyl-1,4-benzoquinol methylase UbiE [Myxococcaceae bacterium]